MNKKKILVFVDWYLPGYKAGGPIQSCANLVEHLKDDYNFSVVTTDTDYLEEKPYDSIKSNQWNILPNGTRVFYFSKNELNRKNIKKILAEEMYDAVYLNGIFSLYFTLIPLYCLKNNRDKLIVIAARGMLAESALSIKKSKKVFFLKIAKALKLFRNVTFHATSPTESKDIRKQLGEKIKINIASNLPKKNIDRQLPKRAKDSGTVRLINIARIAPEKNLKYALELLKNLKENIEFDIYGPVYNQEYWNECLELIKKMPENIKIHYKESIENEKIKQILLNYHFMLMPTAGENFGHIILESLSSGCPVIISDQTPWKNLDTQKAGWDIPLEKPEHFIAALEKCAQMNQKEYNNWSAGAYEYALSFINNEEIINDNRKLFLSEDNPIL